MAIYWGTWQYKSGNGMRVGVELSYSAVTAASTSCTATIKTYTQNQKAYNDAQKLTYTGTAGTGSTSFTNNSKASLVVLRSTRTNVFTYSKYGTGSGGTRSFTARISGATNGVTPYRTVTVTFPIRPQALPAPPTGVVVARTATNAIKLSWVRHPTTAAPYLSQTVQVRYFTGSAWGAWATATSPAATATSYSRTGLNTNLAAQYQVRAGNQAGSSAWAQSNVVYLVPNAPTNVKAAAQAGGLVRVTWSSTAYSLAVTHQVQRSTDGGKTWVTVAAALSRDTLSYVDSPTAYPAQYRVRTGANNYEVASPYVTSNAVTAASLPGAPINLTPNYVTYNLASASVPLKWVHVTSGDGAGQLNAQLQISADNGATWTAIGSTVANSTTQVSGPTQGYTIAPNTLVNGPTYRWRVRTQSDNGLGYGPWSVPAAFTGRAPSGQAFLPLSPDRLWPDSVGFDTVTYPVTFSWHHRDGGDGTSQVAAQLRYSLDKGVSWTTVAIDGSSASYIANANTFKTGALVTWSVRTQGGNGLGFGAWSANATFRSVAGGGAQPAGKPVGYSSPEPQESLGNGLNRAFIYDQRGEVQLAELPNVSSISWGRSLNEISEANVTVVVPGDADARAACCEDLGNIHTWAHTLVIFRDVGAGFDRVWEGPIRRVTHSRGQVVLNAVDVLGWLRKRRRNMYREVSNSPCSVELQVAIQRAFSSHDPNVLPYLVLVGAPANLGDGMGRSVAPNDAMFYDDLGQCVDAGARFTVVGRAALVFHDGITLGRTSTLNLDTHLLSEINVIEDGDSLVTYGVARDDNGNSGSYTDPGLSPPGVDAYYGLHDAIVSSGEGTATAATLVQYAKAARNQNYPAPMLIDIPGEATLSCNAPLPMAMLVPGILVPVISTATCLEVIGTMILSGVSVSQDEGGTEIVTITLQPSSQRLVATPALGEFAAFEPADVTVGEDGIYDPYTELDPDTTVYTTAEAAAAQADPSAGGEGDAV